MSRHVPDLAAAEERLVCLSTSHYTVEDDAALANMARDDLHETPPLIVYPIEGSGFLLPVYYHWLKEPGKWERIESVVSPMFARNLRKVIERGYEWVLFDKDGPIVEELEDVNW